MMLLKRWRRLPPWLKIFIGLVAGVSTGLAFQKEALILEPLGTMFINAIMLMVGPVVFVSLVCGVISISDPLKMGRIAGRTLALFMATTAVGAGLALVLSKTVFHPGKGVAFEQISATSAAPAANPQGFWEVLTGIIPSNAFVAFAEGNVLQIIAFAILTGLAINLAGEAGRPVARMFESLMAVIFEFVHIVMGFAPYGVFALMAVVAGTQGLDLLLSLLGMVGIAYAVMLILIFGVYSVCLSLSGLNPLPFFRKMIDAQMVAFSTASSAATLPVNLEVSQQGLGVSRSIASFVLPLGATVNMNGLAAQMGVTVVFAANLYGIELGWADLATVVATSVIAAIGCAGVPAAALVVMPLVLGAVGIPLEVIGLMAASNRIIDMMSTTANITGDTLTAVMVAKREGELDVDQYYAPKGAMAGAGYEAAACPAE